MSGSRLHPFVVTNTPNIGAPLDHSAAIELSDTNKGFLPNRLTTAQRDAITDPAMGLLIYNTTMDSYEFFDGLVWVAITASNQAPSREFVINNEHLIDQRNEGALMTWDGVNALVVMDQLQIIENTNATSNPITVQRLPSPYEGFRSIVRATMQGGALSAFGNGVAFYRGLEIFPGELPAGSTQPSTIWDFFIGSSVSARLCFEIFVYGTFSHGLLHYFTIQPGLNRVTFSLPPNPAIDFGPGGLTQGSGLVTYLLISPDSNGGSLAPDTWVTLADFFDGVPTPTDDLTVIAGAQIDLVYASVRVGTQPSPIVHRSFLDHWRDCQRYYQKTFAIGVQPSQGGGVGQTGDDRYAGALENRSQGTGGGAVTVFWDHAPMPYPPTVTAYNPVNMNNKMHMFNSDSDADVFVGGTLWGNPARILISTVDPPTTPSFEGDTGTIHIALDAFF